jgi:glycosyltransferase involved in cell wall biosynthesis
VISFNRGSAPELIVNGKTGYVVNNTAEMIAAVKKIKRIDRSACRDHVRRKFSSNRMANQYLEVYRTISSGRMPMRLVPRLRSFRPRGRGLV